MPKIIIGLVGRQGSGKGTAADLLKTKYGADVFRFSAILSDVLNRLAIDRSRDNLIALSETLRKTFGEDTLSYAVEQDVLASTADLVVLDGIRRIEDIAALEPLSTFRLLEIAAPAKVRYERMKGRGEKIGESDMEWEHFIEQENAPTEVTIAAVATRAWKAVDNAGSQEELIQRVHEAMAELGLQPRG